MKTNHGDDPSALVLSFGKYKGVTVADLLARDPSYAEWILAQGWVAERFAELHAAIAARGAATDDTPEHNTLQARFLDPLFREACLRVAHPLRLDAEMKETRQAIRSDAACWMKYAQEGLDKAIWMLRCMEASQWTSEHGNKYGQSDIEKAKSDVLGLTEKHGEAKLRIEMAQSGTLKLFTAVSFERRGVDVVIRWGHVLGCDKIDMSFNQLEHRGYKDTRIELKPTLGDDFPTVMRQMQRLGCSTLVVERYSGRGVAEPQLREMLAANGCALVFVRDIEAEAARLRAERGDARHPEGEAA